MLGCGMILTWWGMVGGAYTCGGDAGSPVGVGFYGDVRQGRAEQWTQHLPEALHLFGEQSNAKRPDYTSTRLNTQTRRKPYSHHLPWLIHFKNVLYSCAPENVTHITQTQGLDSRMTF